MMTRGTDCQAVTALLEPKVVSTDGTTAGQRGLEYTGSVDLVFLKLECSLDADNQEFCSYHQIRFRGR